MPPKPSLPLRDGRLGSSSSHISGSQHYHEPYYSNEDIRLLHEIVTTGEGILPTLPERDRLATNALFQAAEQVLPAHGYDPDHAPSNISRLIFKIGGLRSDGSLMDRFSTVLEGMGINLEIVDPSEQEQHQQLDSSSAKSSTSAAADGTGIFPISPRYGARRRRNSESAAPTAPIGDLYHLPSLLNSRIRSNSFGIKPGDEMLNFRVAGDENRPPRPSLEAQKQKTTGLENEEVERLDVRLLPLRPSPAHEDETDDGFPYRRHHVEEELHSESAAVDEYAPPDVYEGQVDDDYDVAEVRNVPDHYLGSSDTTAQTSEELPAEPLLTEEDRELMEGDIHDFQNHVAHRMAFTTLSKWRDGARSTAQRHQHQKARAISHDRVLALSEAVTVWRQTAETAKRERLVSLGPIRDHEADAEMERRVTRGYTWVIMSKAFAHWYRSSQDEVERTAIARRYILRRRYFDAWRSHQADIEAKIHIFRFRTLLRIWRRAAIHQEVRGNVAIQRYRRDLAKHVFDTWWDEYRIQLADDFRAYHLRANCLLIWRGETKQILVDLQRCLFEDERYLLGEAIATWTERSDDLRRMEQGCTRQKLHSDLQRALEEWRTQAGLSKISRGFSEKKDHRIKTQALDQWLKQAGDALHQGLLSKQLFLQETIVHWRNEAKLRKYASQKQQALKLEILSHWRLNHKLKSYRRLCERRTKERLLAKFCMVVDKARADVTETLHTARSAVDRGEKVSVVEIWRSRANATLSRQDAAAERRYLSTASSCVEHWYKRAGEEGARTAHLEGFAARGAYYVATSTALQSWAEISKQARKERLTRSYHTFRRGYKVRLAAKCLTAWQAATHHSHSRSYEADNTYGGYLRNELAGCVQLWRNASDMMQVIREVAETADQEVWWGNWSRRAKDLRDTELDAADYANEQTLSRCWRTWEYALLQNKGRQHVVATLQESNDKKLCRQVLSHWSKKSAPDGAHPDLRSSVASRRSVRHGNVRAVDTPRFAGLVTSPSLEPQAGQLPQIDEYLSNIHADPPRREVGRASQPAGNPINSAPAGLSASLPQRPRGYVKHDSPPIAAAPRFLPRMSSVSASAGIPAGSALKISAQRRLAQQQYHEPHRAQPQARPDFDEDDISFHPSEGNDFPATFMSTPTRWTGSARPLLAGPFRTQPPEGAPLRRPATVRPTTTTTPEALLDTPYERALRREYGGSATLRSGTRSGMGAARVATTPRVTFADIREESGEARFDESDAG